MKNILKNKKLLIGLAVAIILMIIIVVVILVIRPKDENQELEEVTNNYVTYISINPSIKLEFSQTCQMNDSILDCTDPEVIDYELLNADAKEIYQDIDLLENDKKLLTVIDLIIKTAESNNIEFETVDIYSDWEQMNNFVNENLESGNFTYNVIINSKDNLSEIEDALINDIVTYVVTFDTDGGSEILSQTIKENELVIEPSSPTKNGYTFVEWQLDGERFDFDSPITSNISLVAIWEKVSNNPSNSNDDPDNNQSGNENQNNDSNQSIDNNSSNDSQNDSSSDNNDVSAQKYDINLNDNVQYYVSSMVCSEYVYVNPVCNNKSLNELKAIYPDYDKELDAEMLIVKENFTSDTEYEEWLNEYMNRKLTVGRWSDYGDWRFFPICDDATIPSSYLSELKRIQGMHTGNQKGPRFQFEYINFKDSKYNTFETNIDYSKYGLVIDGGCGDDGSGDITYSILDEATCTKFNLSCGRW